MPPQVLDMSRYRIVKADGDGNCMFNSLAIVLAMEAELALTNAHSGNSVVPKYAAVLRRHVVTELRKKDPAEWAPFILYDPARPWSQSATNEMNRLPPARKVARYLNGMSRNGVFGGQEELQAASNLLKRKIFVYKRIVANNNRNDAQLVLSPPTYEPNNGAALVGPPILLVHKTSDGRGSAADGGHYDAVVPRRGRNVHVKKPPSTRARSPSANASIPKSRVQVLRGGADGDSLFEAVATALAVERGNNNNHDPNYRNKGYIKLYGRTLRKLTAEYIEGATELANIMLHHPAHPYDEYNSSMKAAKKVGRYASAMAQHGVHGGELELMVLANITGRKIAVYEDGGNKSNRFQLVREGVYRPAKATNSGPPLRLRHRPPGRYDAIAPTEFL